MIFYDFYEIQSLTYVGTALSQSISDFTYDYLKKNNLSFDIDMIVGGQQIDYFNNCLVNIRIENESQQSQHIFTGITTQNEEGKINCSTILDYIDCNFVVQEYNFSNVVIEDVIAQIINEKFKTNVDDLKNIMIDVTSTTSTSGTIYFEQDKFTYTLKDLIVDSFKLFNIVVDGYYDYESSMIKIEIGKEESAILDIDFKTFDVIDFSYTDIEQTTNKVNLYEKITDETSGAVTYNKLDTYYLLVDGTHTTDPNAIGRISNVVETYDTVENDSTKIQDYLNKNLINTSYNSELSFRIKKDSKLYNQDDFFIGKKLRLYTDNFGLIETIISEKIIEKNSGYNTIKCGNNNFDLITILKKKNIL